MTHDIKDLKARGYDLIGIMQEAEMELLQINKMIGQYKRDEIEKEIKQEKKVDSKKITTK